MSGKVYIPISVEKELWLQLDHDRTAMGNSIKERISWTEFIKVMYHVFLKKYDMSIPKVTDKSIKEIQKIILENKLGN